MKDIDISEGFRVYRMVEIIEETSGTWSCITPCRNAQKIVGLFGRYRRRRHGDANVGGAPGSPLGSWRKPSPRREFEVASIRAGDTGPPGTQISGLQVGRRCRTVQPH